MQCGTHWWLCLRYGIFAIPKERLQTISLCDIPLFCNSVLKYFTPKVLSMTELMLSPAASSLFLVSSNKAQLGQMSWQLRPTDLHLLCELWGLLTPVTGFAHLQGPWFQPETDISIQEWQRRELSWSLILLELCCPHRCCWGIRLGVCSRQKGWRMSRMQVVSSCLSLWFDIWS